jgi:hypothetical protein
LLLTKSSSEIPWLLLEEIYLEPKRRNKGKLELELAKTRVSRSTELAEKRDITIELTKSPFSDRRRKSMKKLPTFGQLQFRTTPCQQFEKSVISAYRAHLWIQLVSNIEFDYNLDYVLNSFSQPVAINQTDRGADTTIDTSFGFSIGSLKRWSAWVDQIRKVNRAHSYLVI